MAMSGERQCEIDCYCGFPHSAFCGRDGDHLADVAYVAFLRQTALAAGEFGGCVGAGEALRWRIRIDSIEGLEGVGKGWEVPRDSHGSRL